MSQIEGDQLLNLYWGEKRKTIVEKNKRSIYTVMIQSKFSSFSVPELDWR